MEDSSRLLLNRILIAIIIFLSVVILLGTIFGLLNRKNNAPEVLISKGQAANLNAPKTDGGEAYFPLGTLRILTGGNVTAGASGTAAATETASAKSTPLPATDEAPSTLLIISPWLKYPAEDSVFYEEIARKSGVLKGILQSYFSKYTKDELLAQTEIKIEEKVLEEINSQLSLGKISDIYFTDYLFLE